MRTAGGAVGGLALLAALTLAAMARRNAAIPDCVRAAEPLVPYLDAADHVDVKGIAADLSLREFVAAMFSHEPGWLAFLYRVRGVFVRLLGMRQGARPPHRRFRADDVPMAAGGRLLIFTVRAAEERRYWIAGADDTHLSAVLAVVEEPEPNGRRRFHVATVVHYNKWTGPVYFNVIRPFHHIVVWSLMRAAARQKRG